MFKNDFDHGVYGATRGFRNDLITCGLGFMQVDTGSVCLLHEAWNTHSAKYPNGYIMHYSTSRECRFL